MARTPRAKVPKSSGQGVSRLSYQKGYALGNRGSGSPGKASDTPSVKGERVETRSSASSRKGKIDEAGGMNISYGDTIFPTDLKDIESFAKSSGGKATKFLNAGKPRDYGKGGKSGSGFLKGKK
jgi:hypothetical protein